MKIIIVLLALVGCALAKSASKLQLKKRDASEVTASDITYYLYTINNQDSADVITNNGYSDLVYTNFDSSKDTFFIIHGWLNNVSSDIFTYIRPNIFAAGYDVNVFEVDWGAIANNGVLSYISASWDVNDIGQIVYNFIGGIELLYGSTGANFRLIGHSLGAHVAGYVGYLHSGEIASIVGLDPAGVQFYTLGAFSSSSHLDASDAQFVEVIHTDDGLLGTNTVTGTADFFPNNGISQPGCDTDTCSHGRAYIYYAESIVTSTGFWATSCDGYGYYLAGECSGNGEVLMGGLYPDESASGTYYLTTNSAAPYAEG